MLISQYILTLCEMLLIKDVKKIKIFICNLEEIELYNISFFIAILLNYIYHL